MKNWIFQGIPERYDVADPKKVSAGKEETWLVTRYKDEMNPGDTVYLWRAGDKAKRGIYAVGKIESKPEYHEGWGWGVKVEYEKRLTSHIPAEELASKSAMKDHLLFKMPIGTNFSLTEDQSLDIQNELPHHLSVKGEEE